MRRRPIRLLPVVLLAVALVTAACTDTDGGAQNKDGAEARSTLETVKSRGKLICGVNDGVPGFGFVDPNGEFSGFDVEFCRVVAAAVLGDSKKVEFKPLTAVQRFTALQAREIDVLIRNTTWTATRDGSEGAAFVTTTFYDGQGVMVRANSRFRDLEDLDGATVCVLSGTTTELNLESQFRARGIDHTPLSFEDIDTLQDAFTQGRCQAWTADKSQLAGHRSAWPRAEGGPAGLRILEETISKEPLGPVVRDGDSDWFDAVNWAVLATIQAEEFDITSDNVDRVRDTTRDPEVRRFLGLAQPAAAGTASPTATGTASPTATDTASPTATATDTASPAGTASPTGAATEGAPFDPGLGLPTDFAYQLVKQVGNYGEIYNRTVGPGTRLGLVRGLNALWVDDGLLYPPPYR